MYESHLDFVAGDIAAGGLLTPYKRYIAVSRQRRYLWCYYWIESGWTDADPNNPYNNDVNPEYPRPHPEFPDDFFALDGTSKEHVSQLFSGVYVNDPGPTLIEDLPYTEPDAAEWTYFDAQQRRVTTPDNLGEFESLTFAEFDLTSVWGWPYYKYYIEYYQDGEKYLVQADRNEWILLHRPEWNPRFLIRWRVYFTTWFYDYRVYSRNVKFAGIAPIAGALLLLGAASMFSGASPGRKPRRS